MLFWALNENLVGSESCLVDHCGFVDFGSSGLVCLRSCGEPQGKVLHAITKMRNDKKGRFGRDLGAGCVMSVVGDWAKICRMCRASKTSAAVKQITTR